MTNFNNSKILIFKNKININITIRIKIKKKGMKQFNNKIRSVLLIIIIIKW